MATNDDSPRITQLLARAREGDAEARGTVLAALYDELKVAARRRMARHAPAHTLQPTALIHEVYLKLMAGETTWESRAHFLSVAARAMRSILVDHARRRRAEKRGGARTRQPFDEALAWFESRQLDFLSLDEALAGLARENARAAQVVELKYFAGLPHARIAEVLGVSERSVERTWALARAWLYRRLSGGTLPG